MTDKEEIAYLEASEKYSLSLQFHTLFQDAIQVKKQHRVLECGSRESQKIEPRLDILLQETIPKEKYFHSARLQKSLIKLRQAVLPFFMTHR